MMKMRKNSKLKQSLQVQMQRMKKKIYKAMLKQLRNLLRSPRRIKVKKKARKEQEMVSRKKTYPLKISKWRKAKITKDSLALVTLGVVTRIKMMVEKR